MADLPNGVEYSFIDAKIVIGGVKIFGVQDFSFSVDQAKENHYGAGSANPTSRSYGKKEYSGSLELLVSSVEKLRALAPAGTSGLLTDLGNFTLILALSPEADPTKSISYEITNMSFTKDELKGSEGDTGLTTSTEVIFSNINRL